MASQESKHIIRLALETRDEAEALIQRIRQGAHVGPIDLSGAHLVGLDLSGIQLGGADLSGANLSEANLNDAVLMGANLESAILHGASFDDAELSGVNLRDADLSRARGLRTGFAGATLTDARMGEANFEDASFTRAKLDGTDLRGAHLIRCRFGEATFDGAHVNYTFLNESDLHRAWVGGADLTGADLRGCNLAGLRGYESADWIGADIRQINFAGAWLARRFINDQNYLHEFRGRSRATEWLYRLWWLTSNCGRSVTRWAVCVLALIVLFAWFYSMADVNFGPAPTDVSPLYFSVVTLTSLGYGDVLPVSQNAQWLVMIQVVSGYVMLGGLMSIFANKMARRAD